MLFRVGNLSLPQVNKIMDILFSLFLLTVIYGMVILAFYPEKYLKKLSHLHNHKSVPAYLQFRLSEPMFFSFFLGYILASTVVYLFIF
jgi:hypothetical protein